MKIEIVVPALPLAGMELVVAALTRGLAGRGHDVGVTCLQNKGPVADLLQAAGYRVTLAASPGLRTILRPARLRDWLLQRRPDVVHVHSGAWLKTVRAARMAHVPRVVFTMHGIDGTQPWYYPLLDRIAARDTDAVVAVSHAFVDYLAKRAHVNRRKLHVITNGVDIRSFTPGPATGRVRQAIAADAAAVVVGHVARFSPVKNHTLLISAFERVVRVQPQAQLALIGDGPLRAAIEQQVDTLGLRSRVAFLGLLSDLPAVYRDLDILVLPSLSEATSMSILEGMASGLPIVATAVGGTPALLDEGRAGVLVPNNSPQALADALSRLISSSEERAHFGTAARRRAEALYSDQAMLDAYEALYAGG